MDTFHIKPKNCDASATLFCRGDIDKTNFLQTMQCPIAECSATELKRGWKKT